MKMMMKTLLAATALVVAGSSVSANAAVVVVNTSGTWTTADEVVGAGNFFTDTYKAATALTLRFTDAFYVGDSYGVYKNGVFQFNSSAYDSNAPFNGDPTSAFNSGLFSKGTINLAANDIVSFKVLTIAPGFADSTISVSGIATAAVPETATWGMMILGFGMIGAASRSRKVKATVTYA